MIVLEAGECWRLLREADVGRLAVSIGDHPDIFPINHVVDRDSVVFKTVPGTKLSGAVLGRSVAFEADGYDAWSGDAWSVVVKGRAVEIETAEDIARAENLPLFAWWALPEARWVRIPADEVSGRRFHVLPESQPAS
jgi:nitroimidazol reductase NimA-like FMN-containing flavoprotein (pyridoxamine 5'-phosphate oxidase superfamily)